MKLEDPAKFYGAVRKALIHDFIENEREWYSDDGVVQFPIHIRNRFGKVLASIETEDDLYAKVNALELESHQSQDYLESVIRMLWFETYVDPDKTDYTFEEWWEPVLDDILTRYKASVQVDDPGLEGAVHL